MSTLYLTYLALTTILPLSSPLTKLSSYIGLFTLFSGAITFVKACRILAFEYLFWGHMKVGVPILLVNLFTLLLTFVIVVWITSEVFSLKITPLLATSAVFSLVLGLALQDTLGNLFAGIALQFDKPYEIGDWIEIQSSGGKFIGQVNEISWRATALIGLSGENLVIPNRIAAQAEISNFSGKMRPFFRRETFRFEHETDLEQARKALLAATKNVVGIEKSGFLDTFVAEVGESWTSIRLVYSLRDYGDQFRISNQVLKNALANLKEANIKLARPKIELGERSQ
jgi:small-conductance mechanosensitive channel